MSQVYSATVSKVVGNGVYVIIPAVAAKKVFGPFNCVYWPPKAGDKVVVSSVGSSTTSFIVTGLVA